MAHQIWYVMQLFRGHHHRDDVSVVFGATAALPAQIDCSRIVTIKSRGAHAPFRVITLRRTYMERTYGS